MRMHTNAAENAPSPQRGRVSYFKNHRTTSASLTFRNAVSEKLHCPKGFQPPPQGDGAEKAAAIPASAGGTTWRCRLHSVRRRDRGWPNKYRATASGAVAGRLRHWGGGVGHRVRGWRFGWPGAGWMANPLIAAMEPMCNLGWPFWTEHGSPEQNNRLLERFGKWV